MDVDGGQTRDFFVNAVFETRLTVGNYRTRRLRIYFDILKKIAPRLPPVTAPAGQYSPSASSTLTKIVRYCIHLPFTLFSILSFIILWPRASRQCGQKGGRWHCNTVQILITLGLGGLSNYWHTVYRNVLAVFSPSFHWQIMRIQIEEHMDWGIRMQELKN